MLVTNDNQSGFRAELKIIPGWAWALAAIAFLAAQWFFNIPLAHQPSPPPVWARPLLGILAGLGGGAFLLLIGYVNRDAKRRGMSAILWTIVVVIIPNALGFILYFILRQPLRGSCSQCGYFVQSDFNFCPRCGCKLNPSCPQCQHVVSASDIYCPHCGSSLPNQAASVPGPPTEIPG
jgi:RNA polymerase subunit RPABC4/transcription elongation factor Spt4